MVADPRNGLDPYLKSQLNDVDTYLATATEAKSPLADRERIRSSLEVTKASLKQAIPQPNWHGSHRYLYVLSREIRRALHGQVSAREALERTKRDWMRITRELGAQSQKAYWQDYQTLVEEYRRRRDT
jgi:sRNA-binding protein